MTELLIALGIFIASLLLNALMQKWSAERVLGVDMSILKSITLVTARSFAGLVSGFAVGYTVSMVVAGDASKNFILFIAMIIVCFLSFGMYWLMLGKLTGKKISALAAGKTIAMETIYTAVFILAVAIFLSLLFFWFLEPAALK